MRTFEERREEIFRRSEIQIRRRATRRKAFGVAAPVVLGVVLFSFMLSPGPLGTNSSISGLTETALESSTAVAGGAESMPGEKGVDESAPALFSFSDGDEVGQIVLRVIDDPTNLLSENEVPVSEGPTGSSEGTSGESSAVANHSIEQVRVLLSLKGEERTFLFDGTALFDQTSDAVYQVSKDERERLCVLLGLSP